MSSVIRDGDWIKFKHKQYGKGRGYIKEVFISRMPYLVCVTSCEAEEVPFGALIRFDEDDVVYDEWAELTENNIQELLNCALDTKDYEWAAELKEQLARARSNDLKKQI